ncbi:MAG: hypothetical protein FWE84_01275 [Firmicutes bacterium]|nr:hypothetical protein [Bacillota bacterium]
MEIASLIFGIFGLLFGFGGFFVGLRAWIWAKKNNDEIKQLKLTLEKREKEIREVKEWIGGEIIEGKTAKEHGINFLENGEM